MKYLFLFFLTGFSVFSQNIKERKIERIINRSSVLDHSHVSFSIQPLAKESKRIKGFQTSKYMTPASNNKLLTFLAAIETFDSIPVINYIEIDDTLHIEPTGYPLLFHPIYPDKEMEKFLNSFKNILLHWSKSKVIKYGHGWAWDDYKYQFSAEKSSFPVFGNLTKIYKSKNNEVIVSPFDFEIVKDFSIKSKLERKEISNIYSVNPNLILSKDTIYFPFKTSRELTLEVLKNKLNANIEVTYNDSIKFRSLYLKNSEKIYRALLWDSNNLVAESLLLMSGKELNDKFSTFKAIKIFQNKWNSWLPDPVLWFDGSGLSRYNMITSRTIVSVLQKIHSNIGLDYIKRYFSTFGESGNLSENYRTENLVMYAKTGNIKNNSNISGFLLSKRGNWYCFSLMVNHFETSINEVQLEMEKILDYIYKKG